MSHHDCPCFCFIAPPDLLAKMATEGDAGERDAAIGALATSAAVRARRSFVAGLLRNPDTRQTGLGLICTPTNEQRTVYDVHHGRENALPGDKVRGEGDPESADASVNQAYDGAGKTYDFYEQVFKRNSIDGDGMEIISSVHFGVSFDNAFWDGGQMVYGDGSGRLFKEGSLTSSVDVIGHELTHGVTQFTAALKYSKQSGALNESMSDVFGSLVKQFGLGQTAEQADWLIGEGILVESLGQALRSMKAPGTAFKFDDQPATMADYKDLPDDNNPRNDNGGVHINSGIPNKAFYLAATALGGNAWEKAGPIWFKTLTEKLKADAQFVDAANATVEAAGELYSSQEQDAVRGAWQEVGVL
jgi:Zn-dependent metalloprotease